MYIQKEFLRGNSYNKCFYFFSIEISFLHKHIFKIYVLIFEIKFFSDKFSKTIQIIFRFQFNNSLYKY